MTNNASGKLSLYLKLVKIRVVIPVTYVCLVGFYFYDGGLTLLTLPACLGVLFLSSSSSVWNQVMEVKYDSLMDRTKDRPLPTGAITLKMAVLTGIVLLLAGSLCLYIVSDMALLLGLFAVAWYLLVYTLLKRKTAFATIPGALTGALPLLIGWVSAGGAITSPHIIMVSLFVLIWQIPHFWLLMMIYNDDYQKAGFPVLSQTFSDQVLRMWTLAWVALLVFLASMLPILLNFENSLTIKISFLLSVLVLVLSIYILIIRQKKMPQYYKALFHSLNLFMVAELTLLLFGN